MCKATGLVFVNTGSRTVATPGCDVSRRRFDANPPSTILPPNTVPSSNVTPTVASFVRSSAWISMIDAIAPDAIMSAPSRDKSFAVASTAVALPNLLSAAPSPSRSAATAAARALSAGTSIAST